MVIIIIIYNQYNGIIIILYDNKFSNNYNNKLIN